MNVPLLLFAFLAGAMAAVTAVFVRWAAETRSALKASVVVFLLLMMTGMIAGGLTYELRPGPSTAVAGLWIAATIMSASVVLVFVTFLREVRRAAEGRPPVPFVGAPRFVAAVVALVVLNEFLMGWALGLASGTMTRSLAAGPWGLLGWGAEVVVSPWFVFTMAAEMALTVAFLRGALSRSVVALLGSQALIMLLSPPAFPTSSGATASLYLGSAAMIALFVFLMELLYRQRSLAEGFTTYLAWLMPVYAAMMAGLFLWVLYQTPLVFAVAVLLEMVVFFDAILRPERLTATPRRAWQERGAWTFGLLLGVFVAELFMGAALAQALTPGFYEPGPLLALTGPPLRVLGHAVANGFFFLADTTATTWFLLMMGLEMGALVVLRMREVHGREMRVRLGLMLGSYAAFIVFYPSIYYAELAPSAPGAADPAAVPALGWSMGLGTAPVGVEVFGVIAATYLVFTATTLLFGRRAICSVFCSAATMYQGTTIDAMKTFNRSSPLARRFLGSRLSATYRVTSAAVMVALGGSALLSWLNASGRLAVSVGGVDPTVFLYDLSFSVLWYVVFVTIPYAGVYSCVTMGWCYTGLIAGATSRVGFFRLKVRDRDVCRRCTTFDCARSCPVGLTDLPAQFRRSGEYRSSKCCGVGDCAQSCPYGNLYLADVRHTLSARWAALRARRRPVALLPMAGPVAPPPTAAHRARGASPLGPSPEETRSP